MEAFKNSRTTIVDDDQLICETLTQTIRSWGLCAEGFTQPEAALENLSSKAGFENEISLAKSAPFNPSGTSF